MINNFLAQGPDFGAGGYNTGTGRLDEGSFRNLFLQGTALDGLTGQEFISLFIPRAVGLLFVFGAVAFFFMFLIGAVSWILSGGDKGHVEAARSKITNALVGFVLLIGVFAITALIESFFDINILSIDIGPLIIQ